MERNFVITGGLPVNRWMCLPDTSGDGRYRKVRVRDYVRELKPHDFVMVPWRGRLMAAHLVRTFVYKPVQSAAEGLGACQVLVVKESPGAVPDTARCYATSDLKADVLTVVGYAAQRWDIETWIGDAKEVLGLDHCQLTSVKSVMRFLYLLCCCYLFLDEVRAGR